MDRAIVFNTDAEYDLVYNFGVDFCVSVAKASSQLMPKSDWVPDSARTSCTFCNTTFTFIRRRHHCRRCGRLCCGACSHVEVWSGPREYMGRLCDLCYNVVFEKSSLTVFLPFCKLLDEDDQVVKIEIIRAIRNSLQTDMNRVFFIEHFREFLDKLVALLVSLENVSDECETFFQSSESDSDTIKSQVLGVFVNLSATLKHDIFPVIRSSGIISAVLPYLKGAPMDSPTHNEVLQELALWFVRNLSRDESSVRSMLGCNFDLLPVLIESIEAEVRTIQEYALTIMANIVYHKGEEIAIRLEKYQDLPGSVGRLLTSSFCPVQESAARCIAHLSKHSSRFATGFQRSGFLRDLLSLLCSPSSQVVYSTLLACSVLASNENIRTRLISDQFVNLAFEALSRSDNFLRCAALKAIQPFIDEERVRDFLFDQDLRSVFWKFLSKSQHLNLSTITAKTVKLLAKHDERGVELKQFLKEKAGEE